MMQPRQNGRSGNVSVLLDRSTKRRIIPTNFEAIDALRFGIPVTRELSRRQNSSAARISTSSSLTLGDSFS
jgi:hypothetical protein